MATKRTVLKQPVGTTHNGAIVGASVLDLNDIDDIYQDEVGSGKTSSYDAFKSGFKSGFSKRLNTKNIIKKFIRSAAPDGFNRLFGAYDDLTSSLSNIRDSIEKTNASDLDYIGRKARSLLPQLKDKIPNSLYDNLSGSLEDKLEQYKYTIDASRDHVKIRQRKKEEDDNKVIKDALDQNTLVSKVNFQKSEEGAIRRDALNKAERSIRDKISNERFNYMARGMGMAVDSLTRQTAYNEQVNYGIQRKGLELQFRTYMGIRDLLKVQTASLELNDKAYTALVRNTGLPDHQKSKAGSSDLHGKSHGKTSIIKAGAKTLQGFLGGYQGEVEGRVSKSIGGKLSDMVNAARMGEGLPMSQLWENRHNLAGEAVGGFAGDLVGSTLPKLLGRKLRPKFNELAEKHGGRQHQSDYMLDNIPAYLREFTDNSQNQHGWRGVINDVVSPFLPRHQQQSKLSNGGYQTIDQQVPFNQLSQRSLTEIIPGLLARQLQELRIIRTGDENTPREVFDITTGKFTNESSAQSNIRDKIVSKVNIRGTSSTIDDSLNSIDTEGKLSPEARKALGERLLRESSSNRRFDPEAYAKNSGYASGLPPETIDELQRFFNEKFEFDDSGKMKSTNDNFKLRNELSKTFLDIRNITKDPTKEITRLLEAGNSEPLRVMGIITTVKGEDRINYERIWEIMREEVSDYNQDAAGEARVRYHSGDSTDDRFMGPRHPGMVEANAARGLSRINNSTVMSDLKEVLDKYTPKVNLGGYTPGLSSSTSYDVNQFKILDIFNKSDLNNPLVKGHDFKNGNLIDTNTGNVISTIDDITGRVVDKNGMTVLSEGDLVGELVDSKGLKISFPRLALTIKDRITTAYRNMADKNTESTTPPTEDGAETDTDWMLEGTEEPVITNRGLKNGEYRDSKTGKIITSLSDAAGDIIDGTGNIIVTGAELVKGLISKRTGKRWRLTKGAAKLVKGFGLASKFMATNTSSMVMSGLIFGAKTAVGIGARIFNFMAEVRDAYLPGNPTPIFYRRKCLDGEYTDEKGNPVDNFSDVYDVLRDSEGNVVLEGERYKELLNWDGTKHALAKNKGFINRIVNRPLRAMRKGYFNMTKKYMGWALKKTGKFYGGMGKMIFGKSAGIGKSIFNKTFEKVPYDELSSPTEILLGRILETLQTPPGPEEPRRGSWEEQEAREGTKANEDDEEDGTGPMPKGKGWLGKLAGMFGGLFGGKKKKDYDDDDDDDESDYDTSDALRDAAAVDDLNENRKRRKERKNKKRGRKKIKTRGRVPRGKLGKFARAGKWLKNSKAARFLGRPGVKSATRLALRGGGTLIRGAMMGVTAVAGVLGAPVWAVVAGAVAIAAVSYMAYSYFKKKKLVGGDINDLRFMQYGIDSTNDRIRVVQLEHLLDKFVTKNENPTIRLQDAGAKVILETVGIKPEDTEQLIKFTEWLDAKFKPVFLAYIKGLNEVKRNEVLVNEIDHKVPKELKHTVLSAVKESLNNTPTTEFNFNPFSMKEETTDPEKIKKEFDHLLKKYPPMEEKINVTGKKDSVETEKSGGSGSGGGGGTTVTTVTTAVTAAGTPLSHTDTKVVPDKTTNIDKALAGSLGSGGKIARQKINTNTVHVPGGKVDALTAIRLRAYGLNMLTEVAVSKLLTLETVAKEHVKVLDNEVSMAEDIRDLALRAGVILGMPLTPGTVERVEFVNWLYDRFVPVLLSYIGAARERNLTIREAIANKENYDQIANRGQIVTANMIMGTTNEEGTSIWEVPTIFPNEGELDVLKTHAEVDLQLLTESGGKDLVATPTQTAGDQKAGNEAAKGGSKWYDGASKVLGGAWESAKRGFSKVADVASSIFNKGKKWLSGLLGGGGSDEPVEKLSMGGEKATGVSYGPIVAGNGGKWTEIPFPAKDGSKEAAQPTLEAVSRMTGLPVGIMNAIASVESGFKSKVKNPGPKQTATGWFQFINTTWDGMLKNYGAKWGLPPDDAERSLRGDPRINALMGAEFIKLNFVDLKNAFGTEPTDTDIYMAHFLGSAGAIGFLKKMHANGNLIAASVYPDLARVNKGIFYVKQVMSNPRTLYEVYNHMDSLLAPHRGDAEVKKIGVIETPRELNPIELQAQIDGGLVSPDSMEPDFTKPQKGTARDDAVAREKQHNVTSAAQSIPVGVGVPSINAGTAQTPGTSGSADSTFTPLTRDDGTTTNSTPQVNQAIKANQTRQKEIEQSNQLTNNLGEIHTNQLIVLTQVRDYMKRLVELQEGSNGSKPEEQIKTASNHTSRSASTPSNILSLT